MGTTKIQLEVPDELLERIDALARDRKGSTAPMGQLRWLQTTPEGKQVWNEVCTRPKFTQMTSAQVNEYLRNEYNKYFGGPKPGRPKLSEHRLAIIEAALDAYMKPKPVARRA